MPTEKISCSDATREDLERSEREQLVNETLGNISPGAREVLNDAPPEHMLSSDAARSSLDACAWECLKRADRAFGLFALTSESEPCVEKMRTPSDYLAWLLDRAAYEQAEAAREDQQAQCESYTSSLETYESEASLAMHYRVAARYLDVAVALALMGVRLLARPLPEG